MTPTRTSALTIKDTTTAMRRYLTKSCVVPGLIRSKYFISMTRLLEGHGLVEAAMRDEPLHDRPGDDDGGEHRGEQSDDQRGGKSAHRPRAVCADHEPGHQRGDVPVEDGPEHLVVAGLHRRRDVPARLPLLEDAHRRGQRTRLEEQDELPCFLNDLVDRLQAAEMDGADAAGNLRLDDRRRVDGVLEDDRHPPLDVFLRQLPEQISAGAVEPHFDVGPVPLTR